MELDRGKLKCLQIDHWGVVTLSVSPRIDKVAVMKLWLPNSLYRLKPFLLFFLGAYLLFLYENRFITILAYLCIGYGIWILLSRIWWSTEGTIKSSTRSGVKGGQGNRVVDVTKKKNKK